MVRPALWVWSAVVFVFALLSGAPRAEACGGFFCNNAAPTVQSGENLVFSVEADGTLTVHVQILYAGEAERFAWILPLPNAPTSIAVGTDDLFTQLESATAPRFVYDYRTEGSCRGEPACDRPDAGPWGGWHDGAVAADAGASDPTIHLRQEVGPYDAVVLEGTSAEQVLGWLRDNGFDIPAIADPLIADYVAANHVFVAIRLLKDRATGEIQPLVLRYAEGQPCVPLRLTASAASLDMPITAYFLADAYAAPTNYSLVEPDFGEARLWGGALSYRDYVGRLIDDAGGRAFVTDYAGSVPTIQVTRAPVEDLATYTDPAEYLRALQRRGYSGDPQLLAVLLRLLPPPAGVDAQGYYNCIASFSSASSCGWDGTFDAAALSAAITEEIIEPRRETQAMLARHTHLTRLYTTMDPAEMTLDPLFRIDEGLPEVSNVHTATVVSECTQEYVLGDAPQRLELPDGSSVRLYEGRPFTRAAEWCESRGLLPPRSSTGGGGAGGGSASGGGCTITRGAASWHAALALVIAALAIALTRQRRR